MHLFTALIENYLTGNLRDRPRKVPPEVLGLAVAVVRAGKLAVDVVVVGVLLFALGDGKNLVEVTIAVGPVAFANETTRRIVGVPGGHTIGRR